jgi:hypothetical protein
MPEDTPLSAHSSTPGVLLCVPPPLVHAKRAGEGEEDALPREATDHLARWPALQVMAEVLNGLRAAGVPWWAPAQLCARWPVGARLGWLEQRPDLRQEVVRAVTGLTLREGRRRSVSFQAELVDAVVDPAVDARRIEEAFDPRDLVVYGPVNEFWDEVMQRIPWDAEVPPALIEQLLSVLVAEKSTLLGTTRPAILSPWQLRTAFDTRAWQAHLPARVRASVDEARLHKELVEPGTPFTTREELAIVTPAVIAVNFPLRALRPVFSAAGRVLGLERVAPTSSQPSPKGGLDEAANDCDTEVTVSTG